MTELVEIDKYPVKDVLSLLLKDKTTGNNITFATDTYSDYGYTECSCMSEIAVRGFSSCDIQPRVFKAQADQNERTRKKAEVFTPTWICNLMNNHCDSDWFGKDDVFNIQQEQMWKENAEKIIFPENKNWKMYVDSRRLEITCGEAPYIVSRYDATTGEPIPIERRIGLLDRKLRVVEENTDTEEEWMKWTIRAFQSVYGYEFQGDNLLIARINLLVTFCDYLYAKWQREATKAELRKIANIISWNIWQMNGLTDSLPVFKTEEDFLQMTFFDEGIEEQREEQIFCKIQDWRREAPLFINDIKNRKKGKSMKFDYVIGNPPYQESTEGTRDKPVYDAFMNATYSISEKVELITPARFLFNAGATSKEWNKKMLNDNHFKVLFYESDANKVFSNVEFKGGVAITYRDETSDFGRIEMFSMYNELNSIRSKIAKYGSTSFSSIMFGQGSYKFSPKMHQDNPHIKYQEDEYGNNIGILSKGHDNDIATSALEKLQNIIMFDIISDTDNDYIKIIGD